ncbi:MAG: META domain-containing protein [Anaerolineales bacterium]
MNKLVSKLTFLAVILIIGGFLTSCGGEPTPVSTETDSRLADTSWRLAFLNGKPVESSLIAPLIFEDGENIVGATGCNLFTGTYVIGEGNDLDFQINLSTNWDCEETLNAQEQAMMLVLSSASYYATEGDVLTTTSRKGDWQSTFIRMEPLGLEETNWRLDSYLSGQGTLINLIEGTQITAAFSENGILSGSAGCNDYDSTYEADLNNISIRSIASTKIVCSEPEGVMNQEIYYLKILESATTYKNLGLGLNLFNAEGQIIATYVSADL